MANTQPLSLSDRIALLPKELRVLMLEALDFIKRESRTKCCICRQPWLSYEPQVQCQGCGDFFCASSCAWQHMTYCRSCDVRTCYQCLGQCDGCGDQVCKVCSHDNSDIGYDALCSQCHLEPGVPMTSDDETDLDYDPYA